MLTMFVPRGGGALPGYGHGHERTSNHSQGSRWLAGRCSAAISASGLTGLQEGIAGRLVFTNI
jgi:hypothetical protein